MQGTHKYSSTDCPIDHKTWEIEQQKLSQFISVEMASEKLRELNKSVTQNLTSGTGVRPTTVNGNVREPLIRKQKTVIETYKSQPPKTRKLVMLESFSSDTDVRSYHNAWPLVGS